DLARVLASGPQDDATGMRSDREQQDRSPGQLLGPLKDRARAVMPAEGRQREAVARQHGGPEIEAPPRRQDDLGTLERHGGHGADRASAPPACCLDALTTRKAHAHTRGSVACDPPSSSTARHLPATPTDWHAS